MLGGRFLATYGDGLGNVNLRALLMRHRLAGGSATVTAVPLRSQYGCLETDEHALTERGLSFRSVLEAMAAWGEADRPLDAEPAS